MCVCLFVSQQWISHFNRGETFRKEFLAIGEARSLVPEWVKMMSLTATATIETRQQVCRRLGMVKPFLVSESPNRPNSIIIVKAANNIEETFAPLVEDVRQLRTMLDKSIIFCHTYDECSRIYLFLRVDLGKREYNPSEHLIFQDLGLLSFIQPVRRRTSKALSWNHLAIPMGYCVLCDCYNCILYGAWLPQYNIRTIIHYGPSIDVGVYPGNGKGWKGWRTCWGFILVCSITVWESLCGRLNERVC